MSTIRLWCGCVALAAGFLGATASVTAEQGVNPGKLAYDPPAGLCRIDPSQGEIDRKLWSGDPITRQGSGTLLSIWIDCVSLDTARRGDFSIPPRRHLSIFAIDPRAPLPSELGPFIAFFADRDRNRYMPTERFLADPKLGGGTFLGHDERAVYYGLRKVGADGSVQGATVSAYTLVSGQRLVIFNQRFGSNYDDALRSETVGIVQSLHDKNR